jgi:hypothetical protein
MARLIASRRWWNSVPYVLALAALIFIGWSASVGYAYPHDGILDYSSDGRINQLDPIGENVNNLKVGDVIVEIDGKPFNLDSPPYLGKHIGEQVEFSVRRSGMQFCL